MQVEFTMPLSDDPNLDADDDEDVEHRYRRLDNILGMDVIPVWRTAMPLKLNSMQSAWRSQNR